MPKLLFLAVLVIATSALFAQSKSSNEIVAEGSAKTKVKPDLATLTLTVSKSDRIEKNAIANLNKTVSNLVHSLSSLGFANDYIRIASFDISSMFDRERVKEYTASNILKISFRVDNKLIDAFYTTGKNADMEDLDISFETTLSDSLEKATRLKLVQQAIVDAKANARSSAEALNVRIVKVKQVQKNGISTDFDRVEMVKMTSPVIKRDMEVEPSTVFDKFQVGEQELEEKITVVYEIDN